MQLVLDADVNLILSNSDCFQFTYNETSLVTLYFTVSLLVYMWPTYNSSLIKLCINTCN